MITSSFGTELLFDVVFQIGISGIQDKFPGQNGKLFLETLGKIG
jgi:hypothetical protein